MRTLPTCLLVVALVGAACSDDNGPATADSGTDVLTPGDDGPVVDAPAPDSCVIAVKVDDCCRSPRPATMEEVKAEPCLLRWPVVGTIPSECSPDPEYCALVDCVPNDTPTSRTVARVGRSCTFVDECIEDDDCVLVRDARQCCACDEAYPKTFVATEPCFITDTATPPQGCKAAGCTPSPCGACTTRQGVMCKGGTDLKRCVTLLPD